MIVGLFTKSLLLVMLVSLFWAGFQLFLRFERPMPPEIKKSILIQQTIGESERFQKLQGETVPEFFKRFQKSAFLGWESSMPKPKTQNTDSSKPK